MLLVRDSRFFTSAKFAKSVAQRTVGVTVGNFDGMHRGHRELFSRLENGLARYRGESLTIIVSFHPHPKRFFRGISRQQLINHPELWPITTLREKVEQASLAGFDILYLARFNSKLAQLRPEEFARNILRELLRAKLVVVGHDWAFGKDRRGTPEALIKFGRELNFDVDVVEPLKSGSARVSSTAIRSALAEGNIGVANELLGRRFCCYGRVKHGEKRGRKIGFPTVNIAPGCRVLPKKGVYATVSKVGGKLLQSITNVGIRPTFGGHNLVVETHILDDIRSTLYGEHIVVEFVERIRDEIRFESAELLRSQIEQDIALCRSMLTKRNL